MWCPCELTLAQLSKLFMFTYLESNDFQRERNRENLWRKKKEREKQVFIYTHVHTFTRARKCDFIINFSCNK